MLEQEKDMIQKVYSYCRNYFINKNSFPSYNNIMSSTNLNYQKVKGILNLLVSHKYIKYRNTKYYFPEQKIKFKKKKEKPTPETHQEHPQRHSKTALDLNILLLKVLIGIVGILATILSIYYTFIWFLDKAPIIIGFIISFTMVGFSVSAFEFIIYFKNNKNYFVSFIISILWIIVLVFSMSSTIAGQYNQYREKQIKYEIENTDNTYLYYQELLSQEESIKTDINDKLQERKRYLGILQEFNTAELMKENKKQVQQYRNSIYYIDKDIKQLKSDLLKVQEEKKKMLSDNKTIKNTEKEDFYVWSSRIISKVIKISPFIIQFYLNLFPAIFIDIIAPLSFALIIFFKKKEI